jgi:hypothetical protein
VPATYEPIATTTLTTTTASVTFSSISGSYTDLVLVTNLFTNAANANGLGVQLNDDTGSNYSFTYIYGDGSSAASGRATSQTNGQIDRIYDKSVGITHFMNYSNTTTYKTMISRGNTSNQVFAWVDLWRSTSAITKIKLFPNDNSSFTSGSMLTLYGVKSA